MNKKIGFLCFCVLFIATTVFAQNCVVPKNMKLKEKIISVTTNLFLEDDDGNNLGTVTEALISLTKTFTYKDSEGKLISTAKEAFISVGTKINVYDSEQMLIGVIQENILKSWFHAYTVYTISDASGNKIATSEKLELLSTQIVLSDQKGNELVSLKRPRPMINIFSDTWNITYKSSKIDPRIVVMIAAYKTAADNSERRMKKEEEEKKNKERE